MRRWAGAGASGPSAAVATVAATWGAAATLLAAQALSAPPEAPPPPPPAPGAALVGRLAVAARESVTLPVVMIVPDEASFLAAIAAWTPQQRWPVLIDDGTPSALEDAARFLRGFDPERTTANDAPGPDTQPQTGKPAGVKVIWWSAPSAGADAAGDGQSPPSGPGGSALLTTLAKALELPADDAATSPPSGQSPESLAAAWRRAGRVPLGVVVTSGTDPARLGALALAAGRGQWLALVEPPPPDQPAGAHAIDGAWSMATLRAFAAQVEQACAGSGFTFARLGDELDALTLALDVPARVTIDAATLAAERGAATGGNPPARGPFTPLAGESLATTDLIGRAAGLAGPRWAWTGQLTCAGASPGADGRPSASRAVYAAMSALFIPVRTVYLADGYDQTEPWNRFDASAAARVLDQTGVRTLLDDAPSFAVAGWRARAAGAWSPQAKAPAITPSGAGEPAVAAFGGLDAQLVLVNSSGMAEFFELKSARALPGDLPLLFTPAAVHLVHSWSMRSPGWRDTVGGRWLERGAFAIVGSVHEPYLHAFVPTPVLARRLAAGLPLAVAARLDDAPAWKLTVWGDPLWSPAHTSPRAARAALPAGFESAVDLRARRAQRLKEGDLPGAFRDLALAGDDRDLARLALALATQRPDDLTPAMAAAALPAAFRRADRPALTALAGPASARSDDEPALRDMVWHALMTNVATLTQAELEALTRSVRPESTVRDCDELYRALLRHAGRDRAEAFLRQRIDETRDENLRSQLRAIAQPR